MDKGQFNVPYVLAMIFLVSIIIFGLMGAITAVTGLGISNANASSMDKFALYLFPFGMVIFVVIFAIVMLRSAGFGGGQ